jgi:hypothetical protein
MNCKNVKGKDVLFQGVSPEFLWNGLGNPRAFSLVAAKILTLDFININHE